MGWYAPEADGWWERLTTMCRPATDRAEVRQPLRRAAAVTSVLGYGVAMAVIELEFASAALEIAMILMALAAWGGGLYVVYEFRRRLANAPVGALDEREVRIRDRAYLQAHRLGTAMVFLAGVAAGPLLAGLEVELTADLVFDVTFSLAMGLAALPAAVVAWTEPDEQPMDDEAGEWPSDDALVTESR